ncbi:hypothetical protein Plhal304r1_c049g0131471 [Plasmopara halstedii]
MVGLEHHNRWIGRKRKLSGVMQFCPSICLRFVIPIYKKALLTQLSIALVQHIGT